MHTASGKSARISLSDSDAQREEKRELEVLYILDKYGVSDAFYQALSMKCDSLPRASKVKAARSELNKTVKLFSIPTFDGSYRHVETAIQEEITRLVSVFTNISNIWTVCLAKRKVTLAWKCMGNYKFSAQ